MQSIYKIIHTTCHDQWGGLERRIFNESVWMSQRGHTVIIVAPNHSPLFNRAKEYGFKTFGVDFKKLGMVKDYHFLKRLFINEQPDIVNTHGNEDSLLGITAAHRAKIGCKILSRHISAHVRRSWYNKLLYKRLANYVFTTAEYTTNHLKTTFKLSGKQIFSIPSGILPPPELPSKQEARLKLSEQLGVDASKRFLGFVGRVSMAKGSDTTIKAFKIISDRLPDHDLVIVGDSSKAYIDSLWQLAEGLNVSKRIHITGGTDNPWHFYRAFDCNILASRSKGGIPFEGVPQVLLEAMYCSCPVIGAASGGIPDVIEHEKNGLLFDSENPDELAQMILHVFDRPADTQTRVDNALKKVQQYHTIDAMGRNILRIYKLHQIGLGNPNHETFE